MKEKSICIGGDHAGYELKEFLKESLKSMGYDVKDFGTDSISSVDYPDFIHPLASEVSEGVFRFGIIVCGTGNGVSMTANKYQGIRAALCWETEIAEMARLHNDANILALPARYISTVKAVEVMKTFLVTGFEGGRHLRRVKKINIPEQ